MSSTTCPRATLSGTCWCSVEVASRTSGKVPGTFTRPATGDTDQLATAWGKPRRRAGVDRRVHRKLCRSTIAGASSVLNMLASARRSCERLARESRNLRETEATRRRGVREEHGLRTERQVGRLARCHDVAAITRDLILQSRFAEEAWSIRPLPHGSVNTVHVAPRAGRVRW